MSMTDELKQYGVNVDEAISRFMGNAAFYESMVKKFPAAVKKYPVSEPLEAGELKTAEENAHALKGTTGNLSFVLLYEGYTKIVQLIREGSGEEAKQELLRILPIQQNIVELIESKK